MRFLADQDVYALTIRLLRDLGHDVVSAAQVGLAAADDVLLLEVARVQNRILITRDRDYGGLVFTRDVVSGVLYLRMLPSTQQAVHEELNRVVDGYSEEELSRAFVVVEPGRHRFRRLGG